MSGSVVVDLGGTTTRVGVFHADALLPATVRFATPKGTDRDRHLDLVAEAVERARAANPHLSLDTVGVAVGATVDGAGRIRNASMLWHAPNTGFDLAGALRERLPWARVVVANDIAAAAWRYRSLGRFALVTISTGLAVKVFDDALPFEAKLVQDRDGLGGEVGHVPVSLVRDAARLRTLGADAATGDQAARRALTQLGVPWCECGTADDLCAHAGGPATVRAVARHALADPAGWRRSALAAACGGDAERVTAEALATAAGAGDPFTLTVLAAATRPLALYLLQLSAQLGLRRVVVMGGFANGVGAPWFAALRANLGDLLPSGAWFTGWTSADLDAFVRPSIDRDDSLVGIARYVEAERTRVRELHKPVGRGELEVRSTERPRCGREQFVARIAFAGVCGTDLQILRGERGCEPGVLGHECVGRVVEVGADVHEPVRGTAFAVNPNHPYDEHDKLGHNLPGVFRQYAVWDGHLAGRGQLVALPEATSAAWVLLEPLACTVRSLRLAGDEPQWKDRRVLVVGAGISGLLHVLLARRWGADRVLLANRGAGRLDAAVARGVVAQPDCLRVGRELSADVAAATGGAGVDAVILTTAGGTGPSTLDTLWPALADGATVHLFGGFLPDAVVRAPDGRVLPSQPIRSRGVRAPVGLPGGRTVTLVGSRGADRHDFHAALRACLPDPAATPGSDPPIDLAPLISHVVSLDAAPRVLDELAATGRVDGVAALRVVIDLTLDGAVVRRTDGTDLPTLDGVR